MNQNIISEAIKYIEELFKENADGHDAAHTMRVYKTAERLAEYYPESDKEIIKIRRTVNAQALTVRLVLENNAFCSNRTD